MLLVGWFFGFMLLLYHHLKFCCCLILVIVVGFLVGLLGVFVVVWVQSDLGNWVVVFVASVVLIFVVMILVVMILVVICLVIMFAVADLGIFVLVVCFCIMIFVIVLVMIFVVMVLGNEQITNWVLFEVGVVNVNMVFQYDWVEVVGIGMVFIVDGEILTNNYVVNGVISIMVMVIMMGKIYKVVVVGIDLFYDVVVLKLDGAKDLQIIWFGFFLIVKVGDFVIGVGNVGGIGVLMVVQGQVMVFGQTIMVIDEFGGNVEMFYNLIQVDVLLQFGELGGLFYDAVGKVVGMDLVGSMLLGWFCFQFNFGSGGASEGYVILIDDVLVIVKQIEVGVFIDIIIIGIFVFLGIVVYDVNQGGEIGVSIDQVVVGFFVVQVGFQIGDWILLLGGKDIVDTVVLMAELYIYKVGEKIVFMWVDASIDVVFVVIWYLLYAVMVCEVLWVGKIVFVEKLLVIINEQLEIVMDMV